MSRARLHELYETTVRSALMEEFGYKNREGAALSEKIVVNMGVGEDGEGRKKVRGRGQRLTANRPSIR